MFPAFHRVLLAAILILSLSAGPSAAQDYLYSVQLRKVDPSKFGSFIRTLTRDRQGMIWLGTPSGIARYNGFIFDKFGPGIPPLDLFTGDVKSMDSDGTRVFFSTLRGLQVFNTETFRTESIAGYTDDGNPVEHVMYDKASGMWWYRADGFLFNHKSGKTRKLNIGVMDLNDMEADNGIIVLAARSRIMKVSVQDMQVQMSIPFSGSIFNCLFSRDPDGNVLLMDGSATYRFEGERLIPDKTYEPKISEVINVEGGRFKIINRNQLIHEYDIRGVTKKTEVSLNIDVPFNIMQVLHVNRHLLMATTAGLVIVGYRPNAFMPLRSTLVKELGYYEDPRGIAEDSAYYYLAGYNSIVAYDKQRRKSNVLNSEALLSHGILRDGNDLWLASEGGGLIRFDLRTNRYQRLIRDSSYENKYLISVARQGDSLILGGYRNLMVYDKSKRTFNSPEVWYNNIKVNATMIKDIEQAGNGRLLLGTDRGVFLIGRDFNVVQHYRAVNGFGFTDADKVNDILLSGDSTLWVGTYDGLMHFSSSGQLLKKMTRREGLAGNIVASLAMDNDGNIWAGTFDGLSRIDPVNMEVSNYFREDGLPDNEFNHSSILKAGSGEIVMGTVSGFIRFDPASFRNPARSTDSIRISKILYGSTRGDSVVYSPNPDKGFPIRIGKDIPYAKLYFFSNPLHTSENSIYEYKIEGIHPNWVSMGSIPVIQLDNAKTGTYVLRVRIIAGSGSGDITEKSYPLIVEQYFYTTGWFYALLSGALLGMFLLYLRSIFLREKTLRQLRMELAQDLHDELGGYLTGITMNMDLMQKNATRAEQYQNTIRQLGKKALFALKDGLWSLDTKSDNAQQLWDRIKSITKETLEPMDIGYRFSQPEGLKDIAVTILEKRNLLYACKECLTNAIKYGDGDVVNFEWKPVNGIHCITIWNRIGEDRPKADESGHGLQNIKARMQRIHGDMHVENSDGIFRIVLKLRFFHDSIRHYRR